MVVYVWPFTDEFRLYACIVTVPVPTRGPHTAVFVKRDWGISESTTLFFTGCQPSCVVVESLVLELLFEDFIMVCEKMELLFFLLRSVWLGYVFVVVCWNNFLATGFLKPDEEEGVAAVFIVLCYTFNMLEVPRVEFGLLIPAEGPTALLPCASVASLLRRVKWRSSLRC